MKDDFLVIHKKEVRVGTWNLSKGFIAEHRALRKLVIKYKSEFEEFGVIASAVQKPTKAGGRPVDEFLLNQEQSMYLGALLTNTLEVRRFKIKLVKSFSKMRDALMDIASRHQNAEWLETRNAGKRKRRVETDSIKRFVEYAVSQGSQNAERYYSNISKMQNKALFFMDQKFKNFRDVLDLQQLSIVICADEIIVKAIDDGLERGLHYKDIYQLCKKRVESFADIHGKTFIPGVKQISG